MTIINDDILNFHLPRWDELPEVDLYMDQVVSTLEKKLKIFSDSDSAKTITSTMINNYVKQKVVKPPVKKRYCKLQLSYLFVVCILKRVMSISDICESIEMMLKIYKAQEIYDMFCNEFENALKLTFAGEAVSNGLCEDSSREVVALKSITLALANLILTQRLIWQRRNDNAKFNE